MNRSNATAAVMVVLLVVSLVLLFLMPAKSDEAVDRIVTYTALALFIAALALVAPVIFYVKRGKVTTVHRRKAATEEFMGPEDETSDIEREFEALEKEIEREESG